jgi:hypothetical protein
MSPGRWAVLAALAVLLGLYALAATAGTNRGGAGGLQQGLPAALASVLVRTGGPADLDGDRDGCRHGARIAVPAGGSCAYQLRSGFLAVRLRLRLASPGQVEVVLERSHPSGTERRSLDASATRADVTYRQAGTRLTLTCTASIPCVIAVD